MGGDSKQETYLVTSRQTDTHNLQNLYTNYACDQKLLFLTLYVKPYLSNSKGQQDLKQSFNFCPLEDDSSKSFSLASQIRSSLIGSSISIGFKLINGNFKSVKKVNTMSLSHYFTFTQRGNFILKSRSTENL